MDRVCGMNEETNFAHLRTRQPARLCLLSAEVPDAHPRTHEPADLVFVRRALRPPKPRTATCSPAPLTYQRRGRHRRIRVRRRGPANPRSPSISVGPRPPSARRRLRTLDIPSARGTSYSVAQRKRSRRSHPKASGAGRRGSTGDVSTGTFVQVEGRQGPIQSMISRLPPGQPAPPRAVRPRRPRARRCGATTAPAAFRAHRRSSHGRRQARMSMTTLPASPRSAWAGRVSAHHRRQGMGHRRHLRHGRRRL